MGLIETMAIGGALPSGMISLASATGLFAVLVGTLSVAAAAIVMSVPTSRRASGPVGLVRTAEAH